MRKALLKAAMDNPDASPVELLRLAVFGFDEQLSKEARQALAKTSSPAAIDVIVEALGVQMEGAERDSLVEDLGGRAAAEAVEGGLGCDVGGEARREHLHAHARHVDDVSAALLAHGRKEAQDQPERAEVIELHGALEVVEAVVGEVDRAPDRASGVVDQHVEAAEPGLCRVEERVHVG